MRIEDLHVDDSVTAAALTALECSAHGLAERFSPTNPNSAGRCSALAIAVRRTTTTVSKGEL